MTQLNMTLSYEWETVYLREKVKYLFPLAITPFMRTKYKEPAVFRWNVYDKTDGDKKLVYLGEAQEMCPRRLYGFLNPGPTQQTNQKIKAALEVYVKEGLNIGLDICNIRELTFGGSVIGKAEFTDQSIRRLIVAAMVVEHRKRGYTVLDL